jgi:hypothetical protein
MIKYTCLLFMIVSLISGGAGIAHGRDAVVVRCNDLIEQAQEYDGQNVIVEGEAVGPILRQGTFAWVNIGGNDTAIGIWVPASLASQVTSTGSYAMRGDDIRCNGVFHRACAEHGGDLDVHATALEVVRNGYSVHHPVTKNKKRLVLLWICAALCGSLAAVKKHYWP